MGRAAGTEMLDQLEPFLQRRGGRNVIWKLGEDDPAWSDFAYAAKLEQLYTLEQLPRTELALWFRRETGIEISDEALKQMLLELGTFLRSSEKKGAHPGIGVPDEDDLAEIDERLSFLRAQRERRLQAGKDVADLDKEIGIAEAAKIPVAHAWYGNDEDPLFTSREAMVETIASLRLHHHIFGTAVAGFDYEKFMQRVWTSLGFQVHQAHATYEGADQFIQLDEQNSWLLISQKSENKTKASDRRISISRIAGHNVEIVSAADCVAAVRQAVEHLDKYQRMSYIKSVETEYPEGFAAQGDAHRYLIMDVNRQEIRRKMLDLTEADFKQALTAASFKAGRSFNVPVLDDDGRKMFSISVRKRPPHVAILDIHINRCKLVSSYWTPPLPKSRALDTKTADAITRRTMRNSRPHSAR